MAIDQSPIISAFEGPTTGTFTLEANAHVFKMLTTKGYTDIILAGIREISTNAIDAGLLIGNHSNIDVQLPTINDPTFAVRDYGPGLSELDLTTLYTTMGASTKRDSNTYNGCFGIGKLAPLAYTSSFTVESFNSGIHYSYLITTKDGIPSYLKLAETPSNEPTGLRVSYAVEAKDIPKFIEKATFLYSFFENRPNTNVELNYLEPSISGSNWGIYSFNSCYVVMANVPYDIGRYRGIKGCAINVPTGSVSITPGREFLNFDSATEHYVDQLITNTIKDIKNTALANILTLPTPIEQLKAAMSINSSIYSISLYPKDLSLTHLATDAFMLKDTATISPRYVTDYSNRLSDTYWINYTTPTHVLIQDVSTNFLNLAIKAIKSLSLKGSNLILRPNTNTKSSIENLLADYAPYLSQLGLGHLPIVKLSDYADETTKATSSKLASTVFQPTSVTGAKLDLINLVTDTSTYYYLLETPTNVDLYRHFTTLTGTQIIVIPKKVHSIISKYPNFILATDTSLQPLLDDKTFTIVDPDVYTLGHTVSKVRNHQSSFFNFDSLYSYYYNRPYCYGNVIEYIHDNSSLLVNSITYSHPVTSDLVLSVYPELETSLKYVSNSDVLATYLSLKDEIYALHSASGLDCPTVPSTEDYP